MATILNTTQVYAAADVVTHTNLNQIVGGTTFVAGDGGATDNTSLEVDTTSGSLQIKNEGVTFAKIQQIETDKILGRTTALDGVVEDLDIVIGSTGDTGVFFDNDDMLDNSDTAGGSATRGATQQSIKAYVDDQVTTLDTDPVNLTLLNNAVAYGSGYEVPSYYRTKDNIVHLRGLMKGSTNNPIATLPSGFRPAKILLFATTQNSPSVSYGVGRVDVKENGDIEIYAADNQYNALDGIAFLADGN